MICCLSASVCLCLSLLCVSLSCLYLSLLLSYMLFLISVYICYFPFFKYFFQLFSMYFFILAQSSNKFQLQNPFNYSINTLSNPSDFFIFPDNQSLQSQKFIKNKNNPFNYYYNNEKNSIFQTDNAFLIIDVILQKFSSV